MLIKIGGVWAKIAESSSRTTHPTKFSIVRIVGMMDLIITGKMANNPHPTCWKKRMKSANLTPCDYCKKPQTELGAVLFGPPKDMRLPHCDSKGNYFRKSMSEKLHACPTCWDGLKPVRKG